MKDKKSKVATVYIGEEWTARPNDGKVVRVFINYDKNKRPHYVAYMQTLIPRREATSNIYIRKERDNKIVRDTITAENVLMTMMGKGRRGYGAHGQRQEMALRKSEAEHQVTTAIANDRAARRERT
jgi:hypothetical protein